MILPFILFFLSFFSTLVVAKKRGHRLRRVYHEKEIIHLQTQIGSLQKTPTSSLQKEQLAYLHNRLAFAKKHPPHKM